jgi:tRNA (guanine37-N1)-methyltransferase
MRIEVLSLFPEYFRGPLDESMIRLAKEKGLIDINLVDIRDYAHSKHQKVDDRPYGGGPGMVMMPEPTVQAIRSVRRPNSKVIYLSPQGPVLDNKKSRALAKEEHLVLLCGHYEGIDERILELEVDEELSIGDFVLTNGCLAACVVIDALSRFVPGVIGDERAAEEDSFEGGLLDCPHYTRPEVFEGRGVPEVLRSGNHGDIAKWRKAKAIEKTKRIRPDLYEAYKKELAGE